jgi:hypothetical protein
MRSKRRELISKLGICPPELVKAFAPVRARIKRAVDSCPKTVTLEQAIEQIKKFNETKTN